MKTFPFIALVAFTASPVLAEGTRQLDAHEHGVGQLDIALDGAQVAIELHAPGADIVGFEYAAQSTEDRAAVDAALATLSSPLDLFVLPAAAQCSVVEASAELESEDAHDEHGDHDDHKDDHAGHDDHDDHKHDEHKEDAHKDHDHDDHAKHDDHDDHKEEGHDDHDDHDHAEESGHTEFHAEYLLTCAKPDAVSDITFAYFDAFPNALELEVQLVSDTGAKAFEVLRDMPKLDLK